MEGMVFLLLLGIFIPAFIAMMFIPYWTRKTESFGVSIPEEIYHDKEVKDMRKNYAWTIGILSFLVAGIFLLLPLFIGMDENTVSLMLIIFLIVYFIGSFFIYLRFHRQMERKKETENWNQTKSQQIVVNTNFRSQKRTHSNLWFLIPFAITILTLIITIQSYDQIPERMPMQYNLQGEVTNWTEKSFGSVLLSPIMQVYLTLLLLFTNVIIAKSKQQIDVNQPEASQRKNLIFRRRWSAYIIITSIALTLIFTLMQLSFIYPLNRQLLIIIPLAISIALIIGAIVLSITTGQGGSRLQGQTADGDIINRDDDKHWKAGIFYFNKEDPALFLEKRFGVGWTINLARPLAWGIFIAIILLAIGIPLLLV